MDQIFRAMKTRKYSCTIKELYNQLNLSDEYNIFENEQFAQITFKIENLNFDSTNNKTNAIKNILNMYVKKIFKRNK
jgi:hypothetical protein